LAVLGGDGGGGIGCAVVGAIGAAKEEEGEANKSHCISQEPGQKKQILELNELGYRWFVLCK
jgi:hypothetical protein